jgi:hypothetical protein
LLVRASLRGAQSHYDANDFAGLDANPPDWHTKVRHAVRQIVLGFLKDLFGTKPAEAFVLIWLLRGKRSHWFRDLDQAAEFVEQFAYEDIYVGVALSPTDFGPARRCKAEETAGIAALWGDFDFGNDGHKKVNLPPTMEDALGLMPSELPPSLVVHSGHGLQCWWIFTGPWLFHYGADRERATRLADRFNALIKARAKVRGWDVDSVKDLARVLRIPGTTNAKIVGAHLPVYVLQYCDRRYDPAEVEHYLSTAGIPQEPTSSGSRETPRVQPDGPWILDPGANPPIEKFDLLCEVEPRFQLSWLHRRPDFQDQSASAYDLSLSTFAAEVGWSDQEIIDLLIAHRRKHGADLKLRVDYHLRTIGKARASAARLLDDAEPF